MKGEDRVILDGLTAFGIKFREEKQATAIDFKKYYREFTKLILSI